MLLYTKKKLHRFHNWVSAHLSHYAKPYWCGNFGVRCVCRCRFACSLNVVPIETIVSAEIKEMALQPAFWANRIFDLFFPLFLLVVQSKGCNFKSRRCCLCFRLKFHQLCFAVPIVLCELGKSIIIIIKAFVCNGINWIDFLFKLIVLEQ